MSDFTGIPAHTTGTLHIYMAFAIAARYPDRIPEARELQHEFSLSRATAYRWRRAMLDARGALDHRGKAVA